MGEDIVQKQRVQAAVDNLVAGLALRGVLTVEDAKVLETWLSTIDTKGNRCRTLRRLAGYPRVQDKELCYLHCSLTAYKQLLAQYDNPDATLVEGIVSLFHADVLSAQKNRIAQCFANPSDLENHLARASHDAHQFLAHASRAYNGAWADWLNNNADRFAQYVGQARDTAFSKNVNGNALVRKDPDGRPYVQGTNGRVLVKDLYLAARKKPSDALAREFGIPNSLVRTALTYASTHIHEIAQEPRAKKKV